MDALFKTPRLTVSELRPEDVPRLQALFVANPDYFVRVSGQPPRPNEAQEVFDDRPPEHITYRSRWVAGAFDTKSLLQGVVTVFSDLSAPHVWHTALFFLDGGLRGTGAAQELHAALENWARSAGAHWLRLAVIEGNTPAERFWAKCGYTALRTRPLTDDSGQRRISQVMVKAIRGGALADYLALVPRDSPDSALP